MPTVSPRLMDGACHRAFATKVMIKGHHETRPRALIALAALLLLPMAGSAQEQTLANWFDDPFVRVSAEFVDCPTPLGPFGTETERRTQAHHRAEKGTSCYLAGACEKHSYYSYDKDIAAQVVELLRHSGPLPGTSLWVTVQGRVVFIEGCVGSAGAAPRLERLVRRVPSVLQAVAVVYGGSGMSPYRVVPPRQSVRR
jgi:BON domain